MNDNFNNRVKDAFENVEDDFNPELIWQGINAKMPIPEKKKRRFLFWWLGGAGLSLIILFGFVYLSSFSSNKKDVIASSGDKREHSSQQELSNQFDQESDVIEKERITTDKNIIEVKNGEDLVSEIIVESQIQNTSLTHLHNDRVDVSGVNLVKKNRDNEKGSFFFVLDLIKEEEVKDNHQNNRINSFSASLDNSVDTNIDMSYNLNMISLESLNVLLGRPDLNLNIPIPFIEPIKKTNVRNGGKGFFTALELYSGISKGSKVSETSNEEYQALRNDAEKLLEQLSLGARLELVRHNNLSFWSGLKYSRITDRWLRNLEYIEDLPLTYTDYVVELPNGSTESHFVTENVPHDVIRRLEQYNSEHIVSLPLEVRYGRHFGKWKYALGVGVELSYLLRAEHNVINFDELPIIESKNSEWLDPSVSIGLFTSYAIHEKWDVTAGLTYSSLSINNSTLVSDLNSKYALAGLQIGLTRKFQ